MGSMFKSPKQPAALDVSGVASQANAQNTSNANQQAAYNRVNQTDAFGNTLNYSQSGTDANGNPIFSATQGMGDVGKQYAGGLAQLGQRYFDMAGQGLPDSQGAFDQAYNYATANLEPRFARAQNEQENKLRNQGFDPSSEAFRNAGNDLALQQNEARNNLVSSLQNQMFNQGLASRQQQISELQPGLQFGNAAMSGSFVNPSNVNVNNVDIAGLSQASKGNEWQGYNADMQQRNAMLGGLASIGGSLMMAPMTGGTSLGGMLGKRALGGLGIA